MAGLSNIFGGGDYASDPDLTIDDGDDVGPDIDNAQEPTGEEGDQASK